MQEILDYINEDKNKGLLFIVGNPMNDEIVVSFNGQTTYVKFPEVKESTDHVLVQILNKSTFKESMNELLVGIEKGLGVTTEDALQLHHVVGGSIEKMSKKVNKIKTK